MKYKIENKNIDIETGNNGIETLVLQKIVLVMKMVSHTKKSTDIKISSSNGIILLCLLSILCLLFTVCLFQQFSIFLCH